MKKILLVGILVLAVIASVVTGTLAVYNVSLDELSGEVIAKEFAFDVVGDKDFASNIKIAPTESVTFRFSITNSKNGTVSEVPIDVDMNLAVVPRGTLGAIGNIAAKVVDEDGREIPFELTSGVGSIDIKTFFDVSALPKTKTYSVVLTWVEDLNSSDNDYMGNDFASRLEVKAVATQCVDPEHDHSDSFGDGEGEEEPIWENKPVGGQDFAIGDSKTISIDTTNIKSTSEVKLFNRPDNGTEAYVVAYKSKTNEVVAITTSSISGGVLKISKYSANNWNTGIDLAVYLPKNLNEVSFKHAVNGGTVKIDGLTAKKINVNVLSANLDGEINVTCDELDLKTNFYGLPKVNVTPLYEDLESVTVDKNTAQGGIDLNVSGKINNFDLSIPSQNGNYTVTAEEIADAIVRTGTGSITFKIDALNSTVTDNIDRKNASNGTFNSEFDIPTEAEHSWDIKASNNTHVSIVKK